MADYCTIADLRALLSNVEDLADDEGLSITQAIARASAHVDAYVMASGVRSSPSATTFLTTAAANYACYLLVSRRNMDGSMDPGSERFRDDANAALKAFKGLEVETGVERPEFTVPAAVNIHAKRTTTSWN